MNKNLSFLSAALFLFAATKAMSQEVDKIDYLTISKVEFREITVDVLNQEKSELLQVKNIPEEPKKDAIEEVGKVIKVARDLVALGEDVYKLVTKGRPSAITKSAPISVIPIVDGQPVDLFNTENWKEPIKKTYEINYFNIYKFNVVKFRFSVLFSYGGTYDGKGAYITAAQIIPDQVHALFGYDFSATMKLGGIQNNGTKANRIAGATLLMEHTVNTLVKADVVVNSFFITGKGEVKKY